MRMPRWVTGLLIVLPLILAGAAGGQGQGQRARQIRQVRQRVEAALSLTPEQRELLGDLRDRLQDELQGIRSRVATGELSAYEGRTQLREALRAQRQARDEVLTPEQRALLERARRYVRDLQTAVPGPSGPESLETNLVVALGLTETQKILWEDIVARQRAEVAALEALGQSPTADDVHRLRQEHRQAFEALLTPEQRDELYHLRHRWQEQHQSYLPGLDAGWGSGDEPGLEGEARDEPLPDAD